MLKPRYERKLMRSGYDIVIGIDEAGRGPLAGPVSLAGFVYQLEDRPVKGVNDSKVIPRKRHESLFNSIDDNYTFHHLFGDVASINEIGVGKTIENTICTIISHFSTLYESKKIIFLVDGYFRCDFEGEVELIKDGDAKIYSIAAASIIAKYKRDELMREYAREFPGYGFERHVGYGTKEHKEKLKELGPCALHRTSFKPIQQYLISDN